jgi:hypothetical protein
MTNAEPDPRHQNERTFDLGGLRFHVYFTRDRGSTARVFGQVGGEWVQMLRFDDFVDGPHYHAPASEHQIDFDRSLGEPLAWFTEQIRTNLPELLTKSGFAEVLPNIDLEAVEANADQVAEAMIDCVPVGFVRIAGVGLQRAAS